MRNSVSVLLRLTARPMYWRIAVILPGRILWRTYSREAYPEPEAALRRCLERLALSGREQPQTDQRAKESRHRKAEPRDRLPAVQRDEATQHPRPLRPARLRAAWWGWL